MSEVTTRKAEDHVEVLLDGELIHEAHSQAEANAMASWVAFQVDRGAGAADVERMLHGEAPKKATGYSGGLVLGGDDREEEAEAPPKKAKRVAKAKSDEPDLSVLEGRVTKVKKAVESGDCDAWLAQLQEAEEAGKARKTVLGAIEARMAEIG